MKIKYLLMLVEARAFLHELKCSHNVNKPDQTRRENNSTYNIIKIITIKLWNNKGNYDAILLMLMVRSCFVILGNVR